MRRLVLVLAAMALALLLASGVAFAVNKIGTNGPDTLRGTDRADNLSGRGGNDIIVGLGGSDNLLGERGKDVLLGGSERRPGGGDKNLASCRGNDAVFGGRGTDNISGENGDDLVTDGPNREFATDKLSAGRGNDVVGVFNDPAFKDIVTCGGGFDRVFADREDVLAPDCERVADRGPEFERLARAIERGGFFERLNRRFFG